NIRVIGQPKSPGADEAGWKDTWVMFPGEVTRVIAKFDIEGLYVWHCHILSHEDHEMMRPFYVGEMTDHPMQKPVINKEAENNLQLKVYPNPFSTNVSIQFKLQQAEKVSIRLFDNKGSIIKKVF